LPDGTKGHECGRYRHNHNQRIGDALEDTHLGDVLPRQEVFGDVSAEPLQVTPGGHIDGAGRNPSDQRDHCDGK
jgi:hypothetical protein